MSEDPTVHNDTPDPDQTRITPALPPWIREAIGGCRLKRVIASGGMGTVYEGVQDQPRRAVAIKVMKHGVASRSALRRFEFESQVLGRLRHPNIAQVYDAGTHNDGDGSVPYFIMEYIPSALPITRYAKSKGLGTRDRMRLFEQVCAAVHHGHQKGIIHRDLKPSNILVDSNGQVKIIDFGVARATDSDLAITTLQTDVGQLVGTVQYMSPEQVAADPHDIDPRSDVYALGVVLYELLCERLPYDLSKVAIYEATRVIREEQPTRLSNVDKHLRGDVEAIVGKAVEKERIRRYQSAESLRQDIERYLTDEPIHAQNTAFTEVLKQRGKVFVFRHPVVAFALAAVIAWALVEFAAAPLIYRGTGVHSFTKQTLARMPRIGPGPGPLRHVQLVRITDETIDRCEELAAAHGIDGVDASSFGSMRRLHGAVLERLATAGARSVTFDITFRTKSDHDTRFVEGIQAMRDAGGEVIVAVRAWRLSGNRAEVSDNIVRLVRYGGVTATFDTTEDWFVDLYVDRAGDAKPSLVLGTYIANRRPGWEVLIARDPETRGDVRLQYFKYTDPTDPRAREVLEGVVDTLSLTTADEPFIGEPRGGKQEGDLVGIFAFPLPSNDDLNASSIDYEWVLTASDSELANRLRDAAIVIGDCRSPERGNADWHDHPDGRRLPGCYGIAVAADTLLRGGAPIRAESDRFGRWVHVPLFALLGVLVVAATPHNIGRRVLLFALALGTIVLVTLVAYHGFRFVVNPFVPLTTLLIAVATAIGVNHIRVARGV